METKPENTDRPATLAEALACVQKIFRKKQTTRVQARQQGGKVGKPKKYVRIDGQSTAIDPSTRWVAVFTFVLMIIAAFQAWAFIVSERAEVAPIGMTTYPNPLKAGFILYYALELKNGGKQVAVVTDGVNDLAAVNLPLPATPKYLHGRGDWQMTILPDQETPETSLPTTNNGLITLNDADIVNLRSGKSNLWIYGYLIYRDSFSALLGAKKDRILLPLFSGRRC